MEYKLTQYSKGGGCGCKISPAILSEILAAHNVGAKSNVPQLLVGNDSRDDAAVYQIDEKTAVISTTDFFMPIVDDAFSFGQIAAANAISDVYAMGGKPIFALAVLGWPLASLPASEAAKVMEGARKTCAEAGIVIVGGHSIDSQDPIFGLVVNGIIAIENLTDMNIEVSLINILGSKVMELYNGVIFGNYNEISADLSALDKGIYFVNVTSNGNTIMTDKLILK